MSINAEEEGWLIDIAIKDASQLESMLSREDYEAYVATLDEDH